VKALLNPHGAHQEKPESYPKNGYFRRTEVTFPFSGGNPPIHLLVRTCGIIATLIIQQEVLDVS
jgi:hypothetical protein